MSLGENIENRRDELKLSPETEMPNMSLGENIKKRREELKLSQEYVAEQLGVSRQAVSKWETGQSEPTANNLIQLAEVLEISLSELTKPQENIEEQSTSEKERHEKKPNPILRANLIKWAIILQAAFLASSTIHIRAYLNNMDDKVYFGLIVFDLIMLVICSTWVTSNHRFETDKKQRRRNVNIELCYCIFQIAAALLNIYSSLGNVGVVIIVIFALVYLLYVNPKFMNRKLTK